ncbi:Rab geranylgeranyltransferase [Fusarium chlamydosporum]
MREQISDNDYGAETFQLTSKLLRLNPEYYTIWNARRRCLISGLLSKPSDGSPPSKVSQNISATDIHTVSSAASSPSSLTETPPRPSSLTAGKTGTTTESDADAEVIRGELAFTVPLLLEFPKCYWIWNYRLWTLDRAIERLDLSVARRIWEEELGLVSKMLTKDRRNFHAWGYRRHVVAQLESPLLNGQSLVEPEFEYTTKKIRGDLSNFSAWHNRSQLITRLLTERNADDESRQAFLDQELELVDEGLNVGPDDQSLWYYHQFLVLNLADSTSSRQIAPNLTVDVRKSYIEREIINIKDLLEDYPDIKWIYEALIEYAMALAQLVGQSLEPQSKVEVASWLDVLKKLDPKRNGRWHDLEKQLGLSQS